MGNCKILASLIVVLSVASPAWSQLIPEKSPRNATLAESLVAQSQELTSKIAQARSQGKDTNVAEAERTEGERAMQQGNEREALRHFQAGEQALGMSESQHAKAPSESR
jgi:hypothetical protein